MLFRSCFGGAGGQHACLVADALGMTRVLVHPMAGVLSAYGMGLADQNVMREQAIEKLLSAELLTHLQQTISMLTQDAQAEFNQQAIDISNLEVYQRVHVRYLGSDSALVVPFGNQQEIQQAFEKAYQQRFAFLMENKPLMVEALSVEVLLKGEAQIGRAHV